VNDPLEIDEQPRALRYGDAPQAASALLVAALRKQHAVQSDLLARVACEHFELVHALQEARLSPEGNTANPWKAVAIICDRLGAVLREFGVSTEDPAGRTWLGPMRAEFDLVGFSQRADVATPRVAHTDSPLVRRHGKVIRKGAVLVEAPESRKGGPAEGRDVEKGE